MNVGELKELLEDIPDELEIAVAQQPRYPLEGALDNVRAFNGKCYLASGPATEYSTKEAWREDEDDDGECEACGAWAHLEWSKVDEMNLCAHCGDHAKAWSR